MSDGSGTNWGGIRLVMRATLHYCTRLLVHWSKELRRTLTDADKINISLCVHA